MNIARLLFLCLIIDNFSSVIRRRKLESQSTACFEVIFNSLYLDIFLLSIRIYER